MQCIWEKAQHSPYSCRITWQTKGNTCHPIKVFSTQSFKLMFAHSRLQFELVSHFEGACSSPTRRTTTLFINGGIRHQASGIRHQAYESMHSRTIEDIHSNLLQVSDSGLLPTGLFRVPYNNPYFHNPLVYESISVYKAGQWAVQIWAGTTIEGPLQCRQSDCHLD